MSKKQFEKERAIHRAELESKEARNKAVKAYDDSGEDGSEVREFKDDWEQLRAIAIAEFPEGANIKGLTEKQRLVAVAHCLGWSNTKIGKAAGINRKTVGNWLDRPDTKVFIKEYSLATARGDADAMEELSKLEHTLIKCVKRITMLDSDNPTSARLQLDAFKAVMGITRGTKNVNEHVNSPVGELAEVLKDLKQSGFSISEEDEEKIFGELN